MVVRYLKFLILRFLAESNRRTRFCRPLPNRSAKEPYGYGGQR